MVLLCSIPTAVCAAYLAKRFVESRQIVTLLIITYFAMFSATWIVYYLILVDLLQVHPYVYIVFTSLIDFSVVLLVGLVMMEIRELYLLPPYVATIATFHYFILDYTRSEVYLGIQYLSYVSTGQLIGQSWYVILGNLDPSLLRTLPYYLNIEPFIDPLNVIYPPTHIIVMGIYIMIISAPTILLFYYIAWKNRSGRSLGFALGLTILMVNMFYQRVSPEIQAVVTLVGTLIFALGIFGILDRLMPKIEESTKHTLKQSGS
jgi:hypothetical protein